MRQLLVMVLAATVLAVVACGSAGAAGQAPGKGQETPDAPVQVAIPSPAANGALTEAQVAAVAEKTFPQFQPSGYYGACGATGDLTGCPYSDRLKARLTELKQTLMRAQNPSQTREVRVEMMGAGAGIAHVALFNGGVKLDLWVTNQSGTPVVDDEVCGGQKQTSIYNAFVAC